MNKLTAFVVAFALIAANFATVFAQKGTAKNAAPAGDLVALLPASDMVAVMDMRRLTTEALPQLFASKPGMLAEMNGHFDAFKAKTGIDARQFERFAVGVKYNRAVAGKIDFAPVAVTRGNFNAPGLLGAAKIALSGKYREEKIGSRNLLVHNLTRNLREHP